MITNSIFNQKLIATIKERLPKKSSQVELLMDVTLLGKEAAYRRLRGEVPFSFTEACMIATHLGISLDSISRAAIRTDKPVFELRTVPQDMASGFVEYYNAILAQEHEWFEKSLELEENSTQYVMAAYNSIPHALFFPYPNLSRFRIFKVAYQMQSPSQNTFSRITISEEMKERLKKISEKIRNRAEITFVLGRQGFATFVSQVKYFYELHLIVAEDVKILKEELLELISDMEKLAANGKTSEGKNTWIYLSNIDFEDNYIYAKSESSEQAFLDIYQLHSLVSTDPLVCDMQRKWIECLRKFSTLISVSGERERSLFFEKQRDTINELL